MDGEERISRRPLGVTKLAIVLALVAGLGFAGGLSVGAKSTNVFDGLSFFSALDETPDETADLADFWRVWNTLDARFVETNASSTEPNSREKIWGAIEGLAASYEDPHTLFLRPEDAKIFQEDISGNFGGVGIEIGTKKGILTVIAPLKDTPAFRAGILSGDHIIAIDGRSTDGMSTDEAVKIIRGEKGTAVVLRILRDDEPQEISIVRDIINVPTIETSTEDGVFVISFYSFSANSGSLFNRALADFRRSGLRLLLIDLRGNPGGYLESAVSVASHFLPEGATVVTEDYNGNRDPIVHRSRGTGGLPSGTQVAVLVDQGSASASEILAGALQDEGLATLIGAETFGKGSVQELIDVAGGALKVTIARWLTPEGRSISDGGLTPDIAIERTAEEAQAGEDPQKERAIRFLTTGL